MHPSIKAGYRIAAVICYRNADGICQLAWRFAECAAYRCKTDATGLKFQASTVGIRCRLPT